MTDVFISYKRRLRPQVEQLAVALRELGLTVWYDARLESGSSFGSEISHEVRTAKVVMVCWSNDAFPHGGDLNGWVLGEAMIGRERGALVSVLLEQTQFDPPWNTLHHENLIAWVEQGGTPNQHAGWSALLGAVGRRVGRPTLAAEALTQDGQGPVQETARDAKRKPAVARRWQPRALIAAAVIAVGIGAYSFWPRSAAEPLWFEGEKFSGEDPWDDLDKSDSLRIALEAFFDPDEAASYSIPLFEAALRQHPESEESYAWLALALHETGHEEAARTAARHAISLVANCYSFPHAILAASFNPGFNNVGANGDSTMRHLQAAIACEPVHPRVWPTGWEESLRRGDERAARSALEEMLTSGIITNPWQSYARWLLQSAPPGAMLLFSTDLQAQPLQAVQSASSIGSDVAIVNTAMLGLPWYLNWLQRRYEVPLLAAVAPKESFGDSQLVGWRRLATSGTLGRRLLVPAPGLRSFSQGPGVLRQVGPFYEIGRSDGTREADSASVDAALRLAESLSWSGPAYSREDSERRTHRLTHPLYFVFDLAWSDIASALNRKNIAAAKSRLAWAERFLAKTGSPGDDVLDSLKYYRKKIGER